MPETRGTLLVPRPGLGCPGRCIFFQAEDGIRDVAVTGVQTCALPISADASCRPLRCGFAALPRCARRSEEHTSELQSRLHLVCRLLLEKNKIRPGPSRLPSIRFFRHQPERVHVAV